MRHRVLYFLLASLIVAGIAVATEYPSQLGNRDIRWGMNGTWVDNGGRTRYNVNASIIPFDQDNNIKLGNTNLYRLSTGVIGTWKIPYTDNNGWINSLALSTSGLCLKSNGVAAAPTWGSCWTGGGGGGLADNLLMASDKYLLLGGSSTGFYRVGYQSSDLGDGKPPSRFVIYSNSYGNNGFSLSLLGNGYFSSDLSITGNLSVNGFITTKVRIDNEVEAYGYGSTLPDGQHIFNATNDVCTYTGTAIKGDTYYNPCIKTMLTFDGQYWRPYASAVTAPTSSSDNCSYGQIAAYDNWLHVCVATNTWKTTHFDNVFRQVGHGDGSIAEGGGGPSTPPDNVIYSDTFTRANETPLTGNGWTMMGVEGEIDLISNQVLSTDNTDRNQYAFRNSESYLDNQWSSVVNKTASWGAAESIGGPAVRVKDNGGITNGYLLVATGTDNISIWCKYNNPAEWAQIGSTITGLSMATNDNVALFVDATNHFTVKLNGSIVGTATDGSSRLTGGTPGFNILNTTARWDDWKGGNN